MNPSMAEVQTISISDLLSLSRPLTGAASITPLSCFPSLKKHKAHPPPFVPKNSITEALFTDKINGLKPSFAPFNVPVLLVGTVDFPTDPDDQLLSFSDDSSSISCTLLDLDLKVIGCRIQVLAWNFIPFKESRGGLLEIVRWCFLPLLATESEKSVVPIRKAVHSSSIKCIVGVLRAVSPVFTVPWRNQLRGVDSIGFLVEIVTCKCNICSSSSSFDGPIKHNRNLAPEFVYFLGSSSRWRLVLVKLVGKVISLSGLKKKLIFVAWRMCSRGMFEGEARYVGIITGVYMQGMAVELDGKVWLLVCDPNLAPEFSLRNGALISVRNFQLVHPGFSWIQIDMLVCGCKTSINIKAFSVNDTGCHQKEGLVQAYARASLPTHFIQSQQGIFTEFCKHGRPTVNHEYSQPLLKLIVPISYLMLKCEVIWTSIVKKMLFHEGNLVTNDSMVASPCHGVPSIVRRMISSDDLGCILMGHFKCTSSGKLQLVDATGNVDVVVPDMLSSFHCQGIHEIRKFEVVIEGPSMQFELLQLPCAEPLSCKNIFGQLTTKKISNQLTVYVHFFLEDSICLNAHSDHPCMASGCNTIPEGITHLFRVTHKFPANKFPMFNSEPSLDSSLFVEALLLPYDAIFQDDLKRGPCDIFEKKISGWPAYECNLNDHEKGCSKRVKFVDPSDRGSTATECHVEQAEVGAVFPFSGFSISSSPQIPHFAGYLCCKGGNVLENMHASFGTLLLEFFSDCFMKYQIRIQGKLHKNAFPVGMGPGANATFHRVLLKGRNSCIGVLKHLQCSIAEAAKGINASCEWKDETRRRAGRNHCNGTEHDDLSNRDETCESSDRNSMI
ncbi:hypothetical protein HPP92_010557 [Vanilla planifolia]|uniref:CST complex subunit CTC1 n=1 Tax=Vanilla planifolia TaxID=51239 RepID=A0A835R0B9_VANPL|nr:hypothetical protein HPP92_010557 [Vanilla planifolia]